MVNNMSRLWIVGASGHGKVVSEIAVLNGYEDIVFLDDNENITECGGFPVVGKSNEAKAGDIFVAIGNCSIRKKLVDFYYDRNMPVLIHPQAVISNDVSIDKGTVVMAGTVVNPGVKIGKSSIINTSSSVDHDCILGDYVHLAVGAHLCGTVSVGDNVWIGAGSVVINNIDICPNCYIGAGAVVVKNLNASGCYIGVPAKLMEDKL